MGKMWWVRLSKQAKYEVREDRTLQAKTYEQGLVGENIWNVQNVSRSRGLFHIVSQTLVQEVKIKLVLYGKSWTM